MKPQAYDLLLLARLVLHELPLVNISGCHDVRGFGEELFGETAVVQPDLELCEQGRGDVLGVIDNVSLSE